MGKSLASADRIAVFTKRCGLGRREKCGTLSVRRKAAPLLAAEVVGVGFCLRVLHAVLDSPRIVMIGAVGFPPSRSITGSGHTERTESFEG
jgi:hypothetical protein